jgi:hypothetical protein
MYKGSTAKCINRSALFRQNTMKLILHTLLLLLSLPLLSQKCSCEEEFNFVVNYYEENLPGFADNVNDSNLTSYFEKQSDD